MVYKVKEQPVIPDPTCLDPLYLIEFQVNIIIITIITINIGADIEAANIVDPDQTAPHFTFVILQAVCGHIFKFFHSFSFQVRF